MRPIGYYVHHHGIGHWQRARLIAARLQRPCTLIGTLTEAQQRQHDSTVLALPDDRLATTPPVRIGAHQSAAVLHYAPPGADVLRQRSLLLAEWIARARPALMIIDVSVEIALLARLCATPVLYVRLAGQRDDLPHLAAFEASEALIAPFPAVLDTDTLPHWVQAKTFHAGFLAGHVPQDAATPQPGPTRILVVCGRGGVAAPTAEIAAAARALPATHWQVIGPVDPASGPLPPNLTLLGWVKDPALLLHAADVVVGGCGDGLLAEVVAHRKRFICIPEPRPFDEQHAKATRLAGHGWAVVLSGWPKPAEWPNLLQQAARLDTEGLARLHDPAAVQRLANFIDTAADSAVQRYCQPN